MNDIKKIRNQIRQIQQRNKKVEADKAWETSFTRRFFIAIVTYFIIALFFKTMHLSKPFINAIVPTIGFLLSTLSMSLIKNIWIKQHNK